MFAVAFHLEEEARSGKDVVAVDEDGLSKGSGEQGKRLNHVAT